MARPLPHFADTLASDFQTLRAFSRRLELNHIEMKVPNSSLTLGGLGLSYELIYLRVFLLWENFCEEVFTRLVCGFVSNGRREPMKAGRAYATSLDGARAEILHGRDYQFWHSPGALISHSDRFFDPATSYFRKVIASNKDSLTYYAAVRHRIAHAQGHAFEAFNEATMDLAGRRYPGANPGRFLRSTDGTESEKRWLDVIADDLGEIAHQFC